MGVSVANAKLRTHAHGTNPLTGDFEFVCHWGDESIDELTIVTSGEAADLISEADTSQAAFDTQAAAVTSWYPSAFSGLDAGDQATAKTTCRKACQMWA